MAKRKQKEEELKPLDLNVKDRKTFLICKIEYKEEAKNPNNAYFRSANTGKGFKGMFMKADYKAYKEKLIDLAEKQFGGNSVPYSGDIKIISHWIFGTKRRKDLQNCGKLEFDAFNGIIYQDDSQIIEDHRFKWYRKNDPSIVIEIYGFEEE